MGAVANNDAYFLKLPIQNKNLPISFCSRYACSLVFPRMRRNSPSVVFSQQQTNRHD